MKLGTHSSQAPWKDHWPGLSLLRSSLDVNIHCLAKSPTLSGPQRTLVPKDSFREGWERDSLAPFGSIHPNDKCTDYWPPSQPGPVLAPAQIETARDWSQFPMEKDWLHSVNYQIQLVSVQFLAHGSQTPRNFLRGESDSGVSCDVNEVTVEWGWVADRNQPRG